MSKNVPKRVLKIEKKSFNPLSIKFMLILFYRGTFILIHYDTYLKNDFFQSFCKELHPVSFTPVSYTLLSRNKFKLLK